MGAGSAPFSDQAVSRGLARTPGAAGPGPEWGGVALDGGAPVIQEGRQFGYPQPSKARAIDLAVLAQGIPNRFSYNR